MIDLFTIIIILSVLHRILLRLLPYPILNHVGLHGDKGQSTGLKLKILFFVKNSIFFVKNM